MISSWATPCAVAILLGGSWGGMGSGQQVQALTLSHWQYQPNTGLLSFDLAPGQKPRYFLRANPMRIVVDLPGRHREAKGLEAEAGGVIAKIRVSDAQVGMTRLILELAPGTVLQPQQVELVNLENGRWSLQPLLAGAEEVSVNKIELSSPVPGEAVLTEFAVENAEVEDAGTQDVGTQDVDVEDVGIQDVDAQDIGAREAGIEDAVVEDAEAQGDEIQESGLQLSESKKQELETIQFQSPEAESSVIEGAEIAPTIALPTVEAALISADLRPTVGQEDFVSMEDTLAQQQMSPDVQTQVATVPQAIATPSLRLPQPQLGQAPLASNALLGDRTALVDPARMVDTTQFLAPALSSAAPTGAISEPTPVEPAIDPKLLPLNDVRQSAVTLGGNSLSGSSLSSALATTSPVAESAGVRVIDPEPSAQRQPVQSMPMSTPVNARPVQEPETAVEETLVETAVPFLVEFGAPVPNLSF